MGRGKGSNACDRSHTDSAGVPGVPIAAVAATLALVYAAHAAALGTPLSVPQIPRAKRSLALVTSES